MLRDDAERTLVGERLSIRPARADDAEALTRIVTEPEVARWFGRHDIARVRAELLPYAVVVVVDGEVAGWLGFHEESDPDYRHVSLDISLSTPLQNRGYGREALRLVIRDYIARGHHRFTIDPAADNARAIRAYAAVGFRPVGILRSYERRHDGTWGDNLLMDLLAAELVA